MFRKDYLGEQKNLNLSVDYRGAGSGSHQDQHLAHSGYVILLGGLKKSKTHAQLAEEGDRKSVV